MTAPSGIRAWLPQTSGQVFKTLFFLMPVLYFLLYGWYGFDDTDQGFIVSLCYRILNGEVPHQDFFYVRPPLTPLLHTIEMWLLPESIEVIGMRFFGILYIWLSVLFGILALRKFFNFEELFISPWLLATLGFIISMHNYPPMAWHTVDGVLFTALGVFLLSRGDHWPWIAAGLWALALAPMAKQPFAVVPLVGLAAVFWVHPFRKSLKGVGAAAAVGAFFLLLIFLVPGLRDFFSEMIRQSTGATDPTEIIWPGVKLYVWPALYAFVPIAGLWLFLGKVLKSPRMGQIFLAIFWIGFVIFYAIHVYLVFRAEAFMPPRFGTYHAMLFCGAVVAGIYLLRGERNMAWVLTLCAGSWAAGISWGYPAPVHSMLPALFGIVWFLGKEIRKRPPLWYYPSITALAFVAYFLMYQYPFREPIRSELTYHLGDHFPKLNHVYTNPTMYGKYGEVKTLHEKYGDNFTVLPAFPLANYLTNTTPPIQIDWAHDAEMAYDYGLERILQRVDQVQPTVFVDKVNGPKEAYEDIKQYRSLLTKHVLDHWTKLEETEYYEVYEYPGK